MEIAQGVAIIGTFLLAIFAGVVSAQLYALLRTGELGKTWRVLVVAVFFFALRAALSFGLTTDMIRDELSRKLLSAVGEFLEFGFVCILSYALWLQWQAFSATYFRRRPVLRQRASDNPARRSLRFRPSENEEEKETTEPGVVTEPHSVQPEAWANEQKRGEH